MTNHTQPSQQVPVAMIDKALADATDYKDLRDRLIALLAQSAPDAGLAEDAKRYRWLKENYFDVDPKGDGDAWDLPYLHFEHGYLDQYDTDSIDRAIDALASQEPKNG